MRGVRHLGTSTPSIKTSIIGTTLSVLLVCCVMLNMLECVVCVSAVLMDDISDIVIVQDVERYKKVGIQKVLVCSFIAGTLRKVVSAH